MLIFFRRIYRKRGRCAQGKAFERMTSNALKRLVDESKGAFWYHRLFDYKTFIAINPNLVCIKQPADYIALSVGDFYLLECKSSVMPRYVLENVKAHQEDNMKLIENAGGFFWLLILHRSKTTRDHDLYALSPRAWWRVKKLTRKSGHVSAAWDVIARCAEFKLTRQAGVWDLSPLFNTKERLSVEDLPYESRFRMRKRYVKRATKFILSSEFPAVALYDAETEEILIITDIWIQRCIEAWRKANGCGAIKCNACKRRNSACSLKFGEYVATDLLLSQIHELEHWGTEPLAIEGLELTMFETLVEKVAEQLIKIGKTACCPCFTIKPKGGLILE